MFILVASLTYFQKAIFKLFVLFSLLSFIVKTNLFLQITKKNSENSLPPPFVVWNMARKKMF